MHNFQGERKGSHSDLSYPGRVHPSVVINTLGFSLAAVNLEGIGLLVELGSVGCAWAGAVADWGI